MRALSVLGIGWYLIHLTHRLVEHRLLLNAHVAGWDLYVQVHESGGLGAMVMSALRGNVGPLPSAES